VSTYPFPAFNSFLVSPSLSSSFTDSKEYISSTGELNCSLEVTFFPPAAIRSPWQARS